MTEISPNNRKGFLKEKTQVRRGGGTGLDHGGIQVYIHKMSSLHYITTISIINVLQSY